MDIPEDVAAQALAADDTWAFLVEWARKQTLLEIVEFIEASSIGGFYPDYVNEHEVAAAIRALGTPQTQEEGAA